MAHDDTDLAPSAPGDTTGWGDRPAPDTVPDPLTELLEPLAPSLGEELPPLDISPEDLARPWDTPDWVPPTWMAGLNPRQMEAVLATEGPLLVLAGAGSGKTRVLILRIAHLVRHVGVAPDQILGVTFTRKAAVEMRERLQHILLPDEAAAVTLVTFHALGVHLLRGFGGSVGLPPKFSVAGEGDTAIRLRGPFKRCQQAIAAAVAADYAAVTPECSADGEAASDDGAVRALPPSPPDIRLAEVVERLALAKLAFADRAARDAVGDTPPDPETLLERYRTGDAQVWSVFLADLPPVTHVPLQALYAEYHAGLLADGTVDYEDLIALPLLMLLQRPDVRRQVQSRWSRFLVDEYQDTDYVQDHLIRLLAGPERHICAVGDDDQSIYSFRRAKVENIRTFAARFAPCRTVTLDQNYRSSPQILAAANATLATRHEPQRLPKQLWTDRPDGAAVRLWTCSTSHGEAHAIARDIEQARAAGTLGSYNEVYVLFRVNTLARPVEEALRRAGIPYRLANGTALLERADIRDLLAYLRAAANPFDAVAVERAALTPSRGLGPASIEALAVFARARALSLVEAAAGEGAIPGLRPAQRVSLRALAADLQRVAVADETAGVLGAYAEALRITDVQRQRLAEMAQAEQEDDEDAVRAAESRLTDLADCTYYIEEFCRTQRLRQAHEPRAQDFLDDLTTLGVASAPERHGPTTAELLGAVTLMSVHSAKGLEAARVYVIGMEERLFPILSPATPRLPGALSGDDALAEEGRLFYVAITRAMHALVLSTARTRELRSTTPQAMRPSRFLASLPETIYRREEHR